MRSSGSMQLTRRAAGALIAACAIGLAAGASPALAASTTLTSPTTLSGSAPLSALGLSASGADVTATSDLTTTLNWSQPASLSTTFDPNLVRQGRELDPVDSYARTASGSMSLSWTFNHLQVSWDGIGPLGLGSPSFSASGPCDLMASGGDYVCHLTSSQVSLLDTYPVPGPYVKLSLAAAVTITPEALATLRTASFGGNPGGTAGLSLGESPITDTLAVPCTVGAGDELTYNLGNLSSTEGITEVTSLVFDVGGEIPNLSLIHI